MYHLLMIFVVVHHVPNKYTHTILSECTIFSTCVSVFPLFSQCVYSTHTYTCMYVVSRFYQVSSALHHRALGAGSLSPVQQTGRPGSQRSAALRINRHEPLAWMFSATREAAHSQISTNQKQRQSEPLSL